VIEDAVRDLLADRAEHAPVRVDGQVMLERVKRRRRARGRGVLVAAAAAAVGILMAVDAALGPRETLAPTGTAAPASASRPTAPSPVAASRSFTWGVVRFDVPSGWAVNDTHETHSYPMGALVDGPFLGTLPTGPMCWSHPDGSGGCARSHGILDLRPTDGVVAWINVGQVVGTSPDGDINGTGDPGPGADGVCPARGTTFHAFRRVRGADATYRVVLDGCAYGPQTKEYLAKLTEVANSLRRS
jgi:hypothetical protein